MSLLNGDSKSLSQLARPVSSGMFWVLIVCWPGPKRSAGLPWCTNSAAWVSRTVSWAPCWISMSRMGKRQARISSPSSVHWMMSMNCFLTKSRNPIHVLQREDDNLIHSRWPGREVSRNRRPVPWLPVVAEASAQNVCRKAELQVGDLGVGRPGGRAQTRDQIEVEIGGVGVLVLGEDREMGNEEKACSDRRLKAGLDVGIAHFLRHVEGDRRGL